MKISAKIIVNSVLVLSISLVMYAKNTGLQSEPATASQLANASGKELNNQDGQESIPNARSQSTHSVAQSKENKAEDRGQKKEPLKVDSKQKNGSQKKTPAGAQPPIDKQGKKNGQSPAKKQAANGYGEEIDKILVIIWGEGAAKIITQSDITRASLLGGASRTLDDLIFERLVLLDAHKHKIFADEKAVDNYLNGIMREHHLTKDQLEAIFSESGMTYQQARMQLAEMQTITMMLEFKITSRLIVPQKEIERCYQESPEYTKPAYLISTIIIPYESTQEKEEQIKDVNRRLKKGWYDRAWSQPFWIDEAEIAADKQFILSLNTEEISQPYATKNGIEIYKVVEKQEPRLKTLDERYREINNQLRTAKYQELLAEYRDELFAKGAIRYLDR